MRVVSCFLLTLMLLAKPAMADTQQLLQLIDYVGVDYAGAVVDGRVVNEGEYAEMLDFASGISQQISDLPEHEVKAGLESQSKTLALLLQLKAPQEKIRRLTADMHQKIITAYQIMVVPRKQPDLKKAAALYAEQCASCHGETGFGDGPAAAGMEPPPINFHDIERYKQRTLYGLHSTITLGVNGTAMQAFRQISDDDRWSLAFYVGGLVAQQLEARPDAAAEKGLLLDISQLTVTTPHQAEQQYGEKGAQAMAYLRHHPEVLFNKASSLAFSKQRLADVITAYKNGEPKKAYQYAVEAYLEGFELVEQNINAFDKSLSWRSKQP